MKKVKIKDKTFRTLITYQQLSEAIDRVAENLNKDFKDCEQPPVLLCVLNGSIMYMSELMKRIDFDCQVVSIKLKSYEGTNTTGKVKQAMGLTSDITGRKVIIVEDIVDTGNTIVALKQILADAGAQASYVCTLLHKPEAYVQNEPLDYVAMEIPNKFIIGFGLDYDELGRNYKDIYVLDE
ncbi:MAG: hypoxanthine phosphoribosyltransferase [Bacteroidales bacterium]|nr:hypoxanthine phosphoribosyltransferase [Bacteroidales bacterium]